MKKTNIKTFRVLLIKDKMDIKDLAQLVEINGTHYLNRWGDWKASLPGNAETKDVIDAALDALADYVSAGITRDSQRMEEFYDLIAHHPLDDFGFTIGKDNELLVEKTALQNPQERIAQLESELTSAKHSAKPKANKGRWAENKKEKEAARKIAERLWNQNKDLTIAGVTRHDDINKAIPNKAESTLRGWIKDLAPSNKPGRRKNK
jgi:hypothetical protein